MSFPLRRWWAAATGPKHQAAAAGHIATARAPSRQPTNKLEFNCDSLVVGLDDTGAVCQILGQNNTERKSTLRGPGNYLARHNVSKIVRAHLSFLTLDITNRLICDFNFSFLTVKFAKIH